MESTPSLGESIGYREAIHSANPTGIPATMRISSFATAHPHRERERRANAHLTLDPDLATVELDELSRERQAEASTFDFLLGRPDLPKLLEHRLLVLWRDADPGVADNPGHFIRAARGMAD